MGRRMPKDPETQQDMSEYFLGIDVGYSRRRATTGLCLITINKDLFKWQCLNTGTEHSRRQQILEELLPDGVTLTGVGIDGPLAANYSQSTDTGLPTRCFPEVFSNPVANPEPPIPGPAKTFTIMPPPWPGW